MTKPLDIMTLTEPVEGPPRKLFIKDSGGVTFEDCVLVGFVALEEAQRPYLDDLGINTSWAEFNPRMGRWERCLMSESVAEMLASMHADGSFPHRFEAGPSLGEVAWLKARAGGALQRPELPLHDYLIPASAEVLDEVAALPVPPGRSVPSRRGPRVEG